MGRESLNGGIWEVYVEEMGFKFDVEEWVEGKIEEGF